MWQAERKINLRPYLIWVMPTEGSNKNIGASSGIGRRVYFFCMIGNYVLSKEHKIQLHSGKCLYICSVLAKKTGGGAPCGRAEGVYIAMGIRVFGVRGSNGTSTEKGITVAFFWKFISKFWRQESGKTGGMKNGKTKNENVSHGVSGNDGSNWYRNLSHFTN